jgi:hypothetical protein
LGKKSGDQKGICREQINSTGNHCVCWKLLFRTGGIATTSNFSFYLISQEKDLGIKNFSLFPRPGEKLDIKIFFPFFQLEKKPEDQKGIHHGQINSTGNHCVC